MSAAAATLAAPRSLFTNYFQRAGARKLLGLNEFLQQLPLTIDSTLMTQDSLEPRAGFFDPVGDLFSRIHLDHKELLSRYSYMDPSKKYSRNLIATDDERYTLLMVCWNPGKESPIHDHPSDGCWMRVCHGNIQESRYRLPQKGGDKLECFMDETHQEGEFTYITDSMGYHKVGNPSPTQPAMSLHLYCPPFSQCRVWLDPGHASESSCSTVCYDS